ncbi:MAG TPA: extracellular solute-binding protein [Acidimicrobiales bacterium]|nr:extracellular solute-binding protein [Acidimicrobiales bacterium]
MRSLTRRTVAAAGLSALSAGLALTAVAAPATAAARTPAATSGTINVVMAEYSSLTQPYWTALVSRFEKANPSIHVDLRVIDWNTLLQEVPTMIQTHSYPDILNFNNYSTYAKAGLLFPAKEVLSPQVEADFEPSFVKSDSINGTQYGIPWIASVRALGYNKAAFAKAGLMSPPATWAQFATDAEKLTKAGYYGYCLPLGSEEAQAEWSLWMWSNGGNWTNSAGQWTINSPTNMATLNFLRTLANVDKVTEPEPGSTDRSSGCWAEFAAGQAAMTEIMPLGTFETSYMDSSKVQWASAPWPRSSLSIPQFTLGVQDVLMAFNHPGHQNMDEAFLDFVYQKSNYLSFNEREGFLPTTKSASSALLTNPVDAEGIKLLPSAKFYPLTNPNWTLVQADVQSILGTAMNQGTSAKQVLDTLQQDAVTGR